MKKAIWALLVGLTAACSRPAETGSSPLAGWTGGWVENQGQWTFPARFVARLGPCTAYLEDRGWILGLEERGEAAAKGVAVRMRFAGSAAASLEPEGPAVASYSFFLGGDSSRWRSGVPAWAAVRYRGIFPGVDLLVREEEKRLEWDLLLSPGADLGEVEVLVEGIQGLSLAPDGALLLATLHGEIRQPPPTTWELLADGSRRPLPCRYEPRGAGRFGFAVPGRDPGRRLVIDPTIVYSTFLGGSAYETVAGVVVDGSGCHVAAGTTNSLNFPTTPGAWSTVYKGGTASGEIGDVFVVRLDPKAGRLLHGTYIGGPKRDKAVGLALAPSGVVYVAGDTASTAFPVTPGAAGAVHAGGYWDGFVAALDPATGSLLHSTFLGGQGADHVGGLTRAANGDLFAAGWTESKDFPTTPGCWQPMLLGTSDAFLAGLTSDLSRVVHATYLGGSDVDRAAGVAVDAGTAFLAGTTKSLDFPTTPWSYNRRGMSEECLFVTRIDLSSGWLSYSTFIGPCFGMEIPVPVALGPGGSVVVGSTTRSSTFPTTPGALIPVKPSSTTDGDGVLFRLDSAGQKLLYSTFLGGTTGTVIYALAVDGAGAATVAGVTRSKDFPLTPDASDKVFAGSTEVFLAKVNPSGRNLLHATFLGGGYEETVFALDCPDGERVLLGGDTSSADFPVTAGAIRTTMAGSSDGYLLELRLLPEGIRRYGSTTPSCLGDPFIFPLAEPVAGEFRFGLACQGAPPLTGGFLLLGAGGLASGLPLAGIRLWVDPLPGLVGCLVGTDQSGGASLPLPIPANLRGSLAFAQFVWLGTPSCGGTGSLCASDALEIRVR